MEATEIVSKEYEEVLQVVGFRLGGEEFGINILSVREINKLVPITKVPNAPDFVEGVINLRGKVIPIVNLRKRFGFPEQELGKSARIIVVELDDQVIGFIVDGVTEVLRISSDMIEPPPDMVAGIDSEYITGIAKLEDRLLILIDLSKVLSTEQKEMIKDIA